MEKKVDTFSKYKFWTATAMVSIAAVIILLLILQQISSIRTDYHQQKQEFSEKNRESDLTNRLLIKIFDIQSYTDYKSYGKEERELQRDSLIQLRDSLFSITENEKLKESISEILILLKKKESNRKSIESKIRQINPLRDINRMIEENKEVEDKIVHEKADSQIVERILVDTIVRKPEKKNFWKRLSYAFAPNKEKNRDKDTIQLIKRRIADTVTTQKLDSIKIISEILEEGRNRSHRYDENISGIIDEINDLLKNEMIISSKISNILISVHNDRVNNANSKLSNSIEKINNYYSRTLVAGIITIIIIVMLVALIINNFNMLEKSNRKLKEETQKVTDLLESRHQLLLHVSHDIKTPLSSIIGYLNMWEQNSEVENMLNSAKYINSLLENLLKYSSIEQGKLKVEKSEVDIYETIERVVSIFWTISKSKQITVTCDNRIENGVIIESDSLKIEQILVNLISNSIKYSNAGGKVEITVSLENEKLYLQVKDDGIGIEEDKLNKIFELFSRMEEGKKLSTGDGVGMYVVKGLIDMLGGTVDITSEKGKGTCIDVVLPVKILRKLEKNDEESRQTDRNLRLGIIDDDDTLMQVISSLLKKAGVERITLFRSLYELKKALNGEQFDIIITDWDMGTFSGFDVLTEIRKKDLNKETFVAVFTGRNDITSEDIRKLGFNDIIFKPLSYHTIKYILSRYDLHKSLEKGNETPSGNKAPDENVKTIYDIFKDDRESIEKILNTFRKSAEADLSCMSEALESCDFQKFLAIAHKIRPGFIQIGADKNLIRYLNEFNELYKENADVPVTWIIDSGRMFIDKAREFTGRT